LSAREAFRKGNIFAASTHIGKTLSSAMTEQPLSVKVHFDGIETERLGRSFMVTNGRLAYPEEVRAEPVEGKLLRRAVPFLRLRADESNLNFYNFGSGTRAGFLRAAHKIAANDDWQTDADVGRTSAQQITIAPANDDDLGRPLSIMVDAETVETAWPLDIRFGTGSVNVLTPSQALR
jgi:diacylglycerol kinase family enzyme